MAFNDLYKQSIYFEIYSVNNDGEAQQLQESFAFTLPPSDVDVSQTERVTVTPTPSGNFIDRYGLGNANITIGGETGNDELRLTILGANRTPRTLNGKSAWFEFRDRIARYSLKSENYIMKFYDLTHGGTTNIFQTGGESTKYSEAWEVVLHESTSSRSSAKPFFYPYKITMEGVRPLGTYNPKLAKKKIRFISDIRALIDNTFVAVSSFTANLDIFLADNFEFVNEITGILASASAFTSSLTAFTGLIIEYEQKLGGVFENVLSESSDILSAGIQLIEFPYDALETAKDEIQDIRTETNILVEKARASGKGLIDLYDWDESIDPVSQIEVLNTEIEEPFNEIVLTGKQDSSDEPIGAVSIEGEITEIYGYNVVVIKENTRLDKLANDTYGDPDIKDVISGLNNIYSEDELIPGQILLLPVLEPQVRYSDIAVYNSPSTRGELLGRDAKLEEGAFQMSSSDYQLTFGSDTINQAITSRISEKKSRQIRDGSYGITAEIGSALDSTATFELLSVSLQETLVQDPRVTDVYDLSFIPDGDKIYQTFKYDTVTKNSLEYKGVL